MNDDQGSSGGPDDEQAPGAAPEGERDALGLEPLCEHPSLTVIMPIRNESGFIDRSLAAVLDQRDVPTPQVIVVDGQSDDGTPDRVRALAAARGADVAVLDNPRRIVPVSMNLGLERATGDVIVRVDGHCVIAPDYLRRCLDALHATGAECVGGPMATIGETPTAAAIAAAQSSRFGVGGVAFRTSTEAAYVDTLAFGAYRREVFDRIGGFDEDLMRNQDDELNLRLTRAGGRIWMDPSVRSTYFSRGDLPGLWRQYHGYGFYKVRVMRKHRTVPSPRHLVPAAFVAAVVGSVAVSAARRSPWPAAAVLGPYGVGLAASSASAADRDGGVPLAPVAAATVTMHVAYGLGWWAAALRVVGETGRRLGRRARRRRATDRPGSGG
jgi:GT2 family glycosyltransferase